MSMMTSQILKFLNFRKTQKSRYLENETLFFLQIKKLINYTSRATLWQKKKKYFCSGGNLKVNLRKFINFYPFPPETTRNPLARRRFDLHSNLLGKILGKLVFF